MLLAHMEEPQHSKRVLIHVRVSDGRVCATREGALETSAVIIVIGSEAGLATVAHHMTRRTKRGYTLLKTVPASTTRAKEKSQKGSASPSLTV